ncbi:Uncharacterised protein [uncultured archaeon]|nr:Uncharacterised protein [uncultured archaeon]
MRLLAVLSLFALLLAFGCLGDSNLDRLSVSVIAPMQASSGQNFDFSVRISNQDTRAHQLDSIDVANGFLAGCYVRGTAPATHEDWNLTLSDQHTYQFKGVSIAPGSTLDVVFHCTALSPGDYGGDLDTCIDSGGNCVFKSIRTIVR